MFQTIDPITLNYVEIFNKESMPKHVPQVPFWKSSICIFIYTNQPLHTKSITMEQIQSKHTNSHLILQVLFDSWVNNNNNNNNNSCADNGGSISPPNIKKQWQCLNPCKNTLLHIEQSFQVQDIER